MPALDTQTWPRGEVPGSGLIDEGVDLLRGVIVVKCVWPGAISGWVTDQEVLLGAHE